MFSKYDKFLKIARILVDVFFVVNLIASFTLSIVYAVVDENALYILIFPCGAFLSWVIWIFERVWISFFCDVKFIRNKIYGKSNDDLKEFLSEDDSRKGSGSLSDVKAMQVKHLNRLLESGAISEEDYNREMRKLLDE